MRKTHGFTTDPVLSHPHQFFKITGKVIKIKNVLIL